MRPDSNGLPDGLREFDDTGSTRRFVYENVLDAVKNRFPVEDDNYRLELLDARYDGPQDFSLVQQKNALLRNQNLRTPIVGRWRLTDKRTGKVLDEREDRVMSVPYWTDRGTIINNGSEYTVVSQSRLRPGVYARRKSNGGLEAQFNVRPGTGHGFRIGLNQQTGVFNVSVGQGHIPLYQVLRGLGVDDSDIAKSWGGEVAAANAGKSDPQAWKKLYERMAGHRADPNASDRDRAQFVRDGLSRYEVDPDIVERTMGLRNVTGVTPELLLRASQKILNISRGDEQPDKRDSPRFASYWSIEDFLRERVDKDAGRLAKTLFFKARRAGSLKPVRRYALNPYVDSFINGSGLAMPGEEANPLSTLEQMSRISKFGEGGINSPEAVTAEAREVQGDYLGFVDPVQGPECFASGSYLMTRTGYRPVEDITLDDELACLVDNRLEYHRPERVIAEDYNGLIYGAETKFVSYKVTANHRLWYCPNEGTLGYRFGYAADVSGRHIRVMCGGHGPYAGDESRDVFVVPKIQRNGNHVAEDLPPIDIVTWASFLGWYLSEGCTTGAHIRISQTKSAYMDRLVKCLSGMPVRFYEANRGYEFYNLQLASYLKRFGYSWEKYIPEDMFDAPVAARRALLDSLCYGDGRRKRGTFTYCTISRRLAMDVERLCFTLGISANVRFERDSRPIACRTGGTWAVHINQVQERCVFGGNAWHRNQYTVEPYKGKVYCVTVPGGRIYARYGDRGAHWTGNSEKIGVDVRTTYHTYKGRDNKLYGEFTNARTGKTEYIDIATASDRKIAFPGQDMTQPYVFIMKDGVPQKARTEDVDYVVPNYGRMVASNTNMNPMPTAVQAGRQFYASKFWSQFLPQAKGEVPLVDSLMPDGKTTWSEYYGRKVGTLKSDVDGIVTAVDDDSVTVKDHTGKKHTVELVKSLPFNRLSGITFSPSVKVGQDVKAGDMLAHSNFTDERTGAINMGQNLHVAVLPYNGWSYEDAHTISESAARKLATDRLYSFDHDARNGVTIGRDKYISAFPSKFTKAQIETIDENGVVKPGTVLHRGDPIVLSLGPRILKSSDKALGKLSKALRNSFTDRSEVWEHDYEGTVVDAVKTPGGAKVNVSAQPPVRVGDKLVGRFGLKGVVGKIIDDDKMPRDQVTNQPYDMLVNPMGFLSRVAPGQIMEMALGKVAKATGNQVRIPQLPPPEGWANWTKSQLDANGLKDSADVFDPDSGRTIGNVGDGYMFVSAFHHLAEKKASMRGAGDDTYTQDEQPAKGGVSGAKRNSLLDAWGLLSYGANDVIKDVQLVRGTKNDNYWNALKLGLPIPEPDEPFIYKKFLNTLRAGGINVVEKGNVTKVMPQTDADIDRLAQGREITSADMVDPDFEPVKGGLFDLGKTGGMAGNQWSMIRLPEPVPNPIMEEPVRRVLGLTVDKMEDILAGREKLDGKTGGEALRDALSRVDVDKMIEQSRKDILGKRGANRDNAVKLYRYLSAAKEQGLSPSDWMISKVPVLPPVFRPVSKMGDVALVSDMNSLYKDIIENANNFRELRKDLSDDGLGEERLNIYNSVKAAYGLGQPISPENAAKGVKGAVRQVIGSSPKFGMLQSKVLSKALDTVARGVITPDPNLDMDECGIPEKMAWEAYKPYVTRGLVRQGYPASTAIKMIADKTDAARHVLEQVMKERPVIMDRAPTWHKFNLQAFYPHIVDDDTIHVSPLCTSPMNADFDGDQVNVHVPSSDRAVEQTKRLMLPSSNLVSMTDMSSMLHAPSKEQIFGLYAATSKVENKPAKVFNTVSEAKQAYARGEIGMNDPIEIRRT